MRFSLRFWRRLLPASRMPAVETEAAGQVERSDDVDFATLCDGQVVAIPRAQPAGEKALLAAQEAAERRLRTRLREAVRERDSHRTHGPWRAA